MSIADITVEGAEWLYQDPSNPTNYIAFDPEFSDQVEKMYEEDDTATFPFTVKDVAYFADLGIKRFNNVSNQQEFRLKRSKFEKPKWYIKYPLDSPFIPESNEAIADTWVDIESQFLHLTEQIEQKYVGSIAANQPAFSFPFAGGKLFVLNFHTKIATCVTQPSETISFFRLPSHHWPAPPPPVAPALAPVVPSTPINPPISQASFDQRNFLAGENEEEEDFRESQGPAPEYLLTCASTTQFPPVTLNKGQSNRTNGRMRPARTATDISTLVYNELTKLPITDAPFSEIQIQSLPTTLFPTQKHLFENPNYIGKLKYQQLEAEFTQNHNDESFDCPICMVPFWDREDDPDSRFPEESIIQLACGHLIHNECVRQYFKTEGALKKGTCSVCRHPYSIQPGLQPERSDCTITYSSSSCSGFSGYGSIHMNIAMPGGRQDARHQHPGVAYTGDSRNHVMPATPFVMKVLLKLYVKAFLLSYLFSIGWSHTRDVDDVIIYSSIHVKTQTGGGAENHGYPDIAFPASYIEEIHAAGISLTKEEYEL